MVVAGDFGFSEITEDKLPYYIIGWAQAGCGTSFPYVPPSGWKVTAKTSGANGSHGGCSFCMMCQVKVEPIVPPSPEPVAPVLDIHGCETAAGYTWCDRTQMCHIESSDPCNPIVPVITSPVLDAHGCITGKETWCEFYKNCREVAISGSGDCEHGCNPTLAPPYGTVWCEILKKCIPFGDACEYVQPSECVPIEGKAYRCGDVISGTYPYDRYDCVNGKITFTEHDSTACGYQSPVETQLPPVETTQPSNMTMYAILGLALIGGFIMFGGKDTQEKQP